MRWKSRNSDIGVQCILGKIAPIVKFNTTAGVMIARRIIEMLFTLSILPAIVMALSSEPILIPMLLVDFKFVPTSDTL